MSLQLIKLISGEMLMGTVHINSGTQTTVYHPMFVLDDCGAMSLQDALMLAHPNTEYLDIQNDHIITMFTPMEELKQFYESTIKYNKDVTKPAAKAQIKEALQDMAMRSQEARSRTNKLNDVLAKAYGGPKTIQ